MDGQQIGDAVEELIADAGRGQVLGGRLEPVDELLDAVDRVHHGVHQRRDRERQIGVRGPFLTAELRELVDPGGELRQIELGQPDVGDAWRRRPAEQREKLGRGRGIALDACSAPMWRRRGTR